MDIDSVSLPLERYYEESFPLDWCILTLLSLLVTNLLVRAVHWLSPVDVDFLCAIPDHVCTMKYKTV